LVRSGTKVRAKLVDVRCLEASAGRVRVAVVVAKLGFSAVKRNRLKRRLRELVRLRMLPVLTPMDLLVRARREAYDATFEMLTDDIDVAARKLQTSAPAPRSDQQAP
jgi:ribonuclease P protein component